MILKFSKHHQHTETTLKKDLLRLLFRPDLSIYVNNGSIYLLRQTLYVSGRTGEGATYISHSDCGHPIYACN